jgi:2-polyprenyl-3-methyl-5-hydroxy-6-metoxy-1,4-benzoquinol methylase
MNQWKPSDTYRKIAEANRCLYTQLAPLYDETEGTVVDPFEQALLEAELDQALKLIVKPSSEIRALDACGGSGTVSLKLLRRGVSVTLADISPDLIKIFQEKSQSLGFKSETVCTEIADFLGTPGRTFDLIIFSSALHHLENIEGVLTLAFQRLAPGGILLTLFDPTERSRLRTMTRVVQRVDYYAFKIFHQGADLPRAIGRRLRRIFSGASADKKASVALDASTVGMLAEYHIEKGINDLELAARLHVVGYEIAQHSRYAGGRTDWVRRAIKTLGDATAFKLILRKPSAASN